MNKPPSVREQLAWILMTISLDRNKPTMKRVISLLALVAGQIAAVLLFARFARATTGSCGGSEVTISLPEASECWYRDHGSAYWCSWKVPLDRIDEQFIEFSRRVAACYGAARDEDHDNIYKWAYIQLPRNVEVYIVTDKGQGEINLSIEKK